MVSDATLSSDVWTEVKNKLVSANIIITNQTTSATTAVTINGQYNDKAPTRPQITINPIPIEESGWKFNSKQGKKLINVVVDCYGVKTLDVDQMDDQVRDILKDDDIDGITLVGITGDVAFPGMADQKLNLKSSTFTYDRE